MNLENTLSEKKPDTKGQIQYDPLVQKTRNKEVRRNKGRLEVVRGWEKREKSGVGFPFEVMKKFWS